MDIFTDEARDLPRVRKLGLEDVDFQIKQLDPHGWWKISREKGQIPEELSGWFTRPELAEDAIKVYRNKVAARKNAPSSNGK